MIERETERVRDVGSHPEELVTLTVVGTGEIYMMCRGLLNRTVPNQQVWRLMPKHKYFLPPSI